MATLQTVQKIGPVLDLFTVQQPEWGVSEVAAAIDMPRSSAHALLSSLVKTGLLQSRGRGRYRLGWRIVELNQTIRGTVDVRSCASPALQSLSDEYGETIHLAVLERYRVLYVDKMEGLHAVNVAGAPVGSRHEPHSSAVGKVLLAQCSPTEITSNIVNKPLRRFTPNTVVDSAILAEELRAVRAAGYAVDQGETVRQVHCVAAPVRDDMGVVVAAIGMASPVGRFVPAQAEYRRAVTAAATKASRALAASLQPTAAAPNDGRDLAAVS